MRLWKIACEYVMFSHASFLCKTSVRVCIRSICEYEDFYASMYNRFRASMVLSTMYASMDFNPCEYVTFWSCEFLVPTLHASMEWLHLMRVWNIRPCEFRWNCCLRVSKTNSMRVWPNIMRVCIKCHATFTPELPLASILSCEFGTQIWFLRVLNHIEARLP